MQDDEDWRQFLLSGHVFFSQQLHVLLFFVWSVGIHVFGWIQDVFVIVNDWFSVVHVAVTDLDDIVFEDFSELVVSREVIVC